MSSRTEARPDEIYKTLNNIPAEQVSNLTFFFKILAIFFYLADIVTDWTLVYHYNQIGKVAEFWWTLMFIIIPSLVIAAVNMRMYSQDKQEHPLMKCRWLWIIVLVLQLSPILRSIDSLAYAIKSRRAECKGKVKDQETNYHLMLKEDSDAALLRIFECFLEAAPQVVLQMSLLILMHKDLQDLAVLQMVKITWSVVSLGLCPALYQRAIRLPQADKLNMDRTGTILQVIWRVLVTWSRIISISMLVNVVGHWTTLACVCHIALMGTYIQIYHRPSLKERNKLAKIAFSFALGGIYLFEFIALRNDRNRYRFMAFYGICFIENFVCACLWYVYADDVILSSMYFYPVLVCSVAPFCIGICVMLVYYVFFHPNVRGSTRTLELRNLNEGSKVSDAMSTLLQYDQENNSARHSSFAQSRPESPTQPEVICSSKGAKSDSSEKDAIKN